MNISKHLDSLAESAAFNQIDAHIDQECRHMSRVAVVTMISKGAWTATDRIMLMAEDGLATEGFSVALGQSLFQTIRRIDQS